MKKSLAVILGFILIMAIILPASAFSSVAVKGIKLDKTKISLNIGETYKLKVTLTPAKTTQKSLTFVTGNKKIATVDATGKITAVGKGNTTITVYTYNKKIFAKCNVTVTQPAPIKFTAMAPLFNSFNPKDTPVQKKLLQILSQKLGRQVTFDIKYYNYGTEYGEKMNLAVNSGDLPDFICLGGGTTLAGSDNTYQGTSSIINKLGEDGMFVNLTKYNIPNYTRKMKECGQLISYMYTKKGDCYFVPRFYENPYGTVAADRGLVIDKTVFDYNKIPYPTTLDKLFDAAVQLKKLYPNSTPVIPIYTGGSGSLTRTFNDVFATRHKGQNGFNGKEYVIEGVGDKYKAMLAYLNKLYKNNLVPKDFTAWNNDMIGAALKNVTAFVWFTYSYNPSFLKELSETTGHKYLNIGYSLCENSNGWWLQRGPNTKFSANLDEGALAISAKSKHINECVKLLDAYLSDEVWTLLTWGIEGESYTVSADGTKSFTKKYSNPQGLTPEENPVMALGIQTLYGDLLASTGLAPAFTARNQEGVGKDTYVEYLMPDGTVVSENAYIFAREHWKYEKMEPENCVDKSLPVLTSDEISKYSQMTAAMFTYITECMPKFISGEMSLEKEWQTYLNQCNKLCDIKAAESIYNAKVEGNYYNKK